MTDEIQKTALFELHRSLGGKIVPFAGWSLPVQYTGLKDEHLTVREKAGLFDVSHMGEIAIRGPSALPFVQWAVTNDAAKLETGQAQYSLLCRANGTIVDDLLVYCLTPGTDYLLVVNASNKDKDYSFLTEIAADFCNANPSLKFELKDVSSKYSQIALQGPASEKILQKLVTKPLTGLKVFRFFQEELPEIGTALISRTGYTGEDGFEIYVPWASGPTLFQALLKLGESEGVKPAGLGARDTLRLEAKLPLYGNEMDDSTTPYDVGLQWAVKLSKGESVSFKALIEKAAQTEGRTVLVCLKMVDRGIPRTGYPIFSTGGKALGLITSGTHSPTLDTPIGLARLPKSMESPGTEVFIEIRGTKLRAEVVASPFYKKKPLNN